MSKKHPNWKDLNKDDLSRFHQQIKDYYNSILHPVELVITRDYTDWIWKNKLKKKLVSSDAVHHIIPRSCGGTDDPRNLVVLSLASHSEVHQYLYRDNPDNVSMRACCTMLRVWCKKKGIQYLTVARTGKIAKPELYKKYYGERNDDFEYYN